MIDYSVEENGSVYIHVIFLKANISSWQVRQDLCSIDDSWQFLEWHEGIGDFLLKTILRVYDVWLMTTCASADPNFFSDE